MRQTRPELFSEVEVWIDGGVRRGTDVVKGASSSVPCLFSGGPQGLTSLPTPFAALCLGAKAVGLGRPFLYGNGTYGQAGAERVIESAPLPPHHSSSRRPHR